MRGAGNSSDVQRHIALCAQLGCDVAFLGEDREREFWTVHAQWVTPRGAAAILKLTAGCSGPRSVDSVVRSMCWGHQSCLRFKGNCGRGDGAAPLLLSPGSQTNSLRCLHAPNMSFETLDGACWSGIVGQDRLGVKQFLRKHANWMLGGCNKYSRRTAAQSGRPAILDRAREKNSRARRRPVRPASRHGSL